jgi:hypothetical protein
MRHAAGQVSLFFLFPHMQLSICHANVICQGWEVYFLHDANKLIYRSLLSRSLALSQHKKQTTNKQTFRQTAENSSRTTLSIIFPTATKWSSFWSDYLPLKALQSVMHVSRTEWTLAVFTWGCWKQNGQCDWLHKELNVPSFYAKF